MSVQKRIGSLREQFYGVDRHQPVPHCHHSVFAQCSQHAIDVSGGETEIVTELPLLEWQLIRHGFRRDLT